MSQFARQLGVAMAAIGAALVKSEITDWETTGLNVAYDVVMAALGQCDARYIDALHRAEEAEEELLKLDGADEEL